MRAYASVVLGGGWLHRWRCLRQTFEAQRGRWMKFGKADQKALALWAADCAEHVLPIFETNRATDDRPWEAIEAGRAWARDLISCAKARAAASAAHAAARETDDVAAREAAHAAGHAAATAHVGKHAVHAAAYAVKAVRCRAHRNEVDRLAAEEREWQIQRLPKRLRLVVFSTPSTRGAGGGKRI